MLTTGSPWVPIRRTSRRQPSNSKESNLPLFLSPFEELVTAAPGWARSVPGAVPARYRGNRSTGMGSTGPPADGPSTARSAPGNDDGAARSGTLPDAPIGAPRSERGNGLLSGCYRALVRHMTPVIGLSVGPPAVTSAVGPLRAAPQAPNGGRVKEGLICRCREGAWASCGVGDVLDGWSTHDGGTRCRRPVR